MTSRARFAITLAAVLALHACLMYHFTAPPLLFAGEAPAEDVHAMTRWLLESAASLGDAAAGYDPMHMGGRLVERWPETPAGVLGHVVMLAVHHGASVDRAYGLVLEALHASVPLLGFGAALALGLGAFEAVVAALLWALLWWFDSLTHALWYSGRVGFLLASLLGPTVVALGARALGGERRVLFGAAAAVLAALTLAVDEPTGVVFSSRPSLIPLDLLDVLNDGYGVDGNLRTAWRTMALTGAFIAFWRWGQSDARTRALGGTIVVGLGLAYLGGLAPVPWPVDPYALLVPVSLLAALPTAWLLPRVLTSASLGRVPGAAPALVALAVGLALPRLGRTVLSYVPELLPERVLRSGADFRVSSLTGPNERMPSALRHGSAPPLFGLLASRAADVREGRILVLDRALAAHLARRTELEIVGPLSLRGGTTELADPRAEVPADRLKVLIERYAVHWVVASGPVSEIDHRADLVIPIEVIHAARLYRVRAPTSLVVEGTAAHVRAERNRVVVSGATGKRVVLGFHHDPALVCRPACRAEAGGAFTVIVDPPADFVLTHGAAR